MIALAAGLALTLSQTVLAQSPDAADQRLRPLTYVVHEEAGYDAAVVELWRRRSLPIDTIALAPPPDVSWIQYGPIEANDGLPKAWWAYSVSDVRERMDDVSADTEWIVWDWGPGSERFENERRTPRHRAEELREIADIKGWNIAVAVPAALPLEGVKSIAEYMDAVYLIADESAPVDDDEALRAFAQAVAQGNGRCEVGFVLVAGDSEAEADAAVELFERTQLWAHRYALRSYEAPLGPGGLTRILDGLDAAAVAPPPARGMFADSMQGPETPLDQRTEALIQYSVMGLSVPFILGLVWLVRSYTPKHAPRAKPPAE